MYIIQKRNRKYITLKGFFADVIPVKSGRLVMWPRLYNVCKKALFHLTVFQILRYIVEKPMKINFIETVFSQCRFNKLRGESPRLKFAVKLICRTLEKIQYFGNPVFIRIRFNDYYQALLDKNIDSIHLTYAPAFVLSSINAAMLLF